MAQKKAAYFLIFVLLFSVSVTFVYAKPGTCKNPNGGTYCNSKSQVSDCACDAACGVYGDCCDDYKGVCDSSTVSGKQLDSVSNTPPLGNLDAANCDIIGGWAIDMDTRSAAIAIHVYKDGPAGSGTFVTASTTTGLRQDINNIYDDSSTVNTHGFTIATPDSLKDGKSHDIYIHGIDSTTPAAGPNPVLSGTPKKIQCEKAPTANITANDADSIIAVPYGSSVKITWTSTDAKSCDVYRGTNVERGDIVWSDTSNTRYATITSDTVFRLICTGPGGTASDEITVRSGNFDLSGYPDMFIKGNSFNGALVVGDKASNNDVLAMSDIISGLKGMAVGPVKLASEVRSIEQNILSVGGACANAITAQIEGYPQDCTNGLKPGVGKINLYTHNGYAHLVVNGYSDSDTSAAAKVLANYKDYNLIGTEYVVESPVQKCIDSDADKDHPDGKNYYVKGTTKPCGPSEKCMEQTDSCYAQSEGNLNTLLEFYCSNKGSLGKTYYDCPNGCKDGACITTKVTGQTWIHNTESTSMACEQVCSSKGSKLLVNGCYAKDFQNQPKLCTVSSAGRCIDYNANNLITMDYSTACCCEGTDFKGCTSTDGDSPFVKGTTSDGKGTTRTDTCNGNQILDYKCDAWGQVSNFYDYNCPNGCKDGACIQDFPSCSKCAEIASGLTTPYFDPTRCHSMIFNGSYSVVNDYFAYTAVQCESNQFVGGVTHINCPSYYTDSRVVVGTAWYENSLPYLIEYTCADQTGNLNAPSDILAYCCDITSGITTGYGDVTSKADVVSTQKRHSITVNKQGKITVT